MLCLRLAEVFQVGDHLMYFLDRRTSQTYILLTRYVPLKRQGAHRKNEKALYGIVYIFSNTCHCYRWPDHSKTTKVALVDWCNHAKIGIHLTRCAKYFCTLSKTSKRQLVVVNIGKNVTGNWSVTSCYIILGTCA